MRTARFVCAAVVLGAAVAEAVWLASFRVSYGPVWWNALAAVSLLAVGIALAERLLPERARVLRRWMERALLNPLPEAFRPHVLVRRGIALVPKALRLALSGLDWFVADPVRVLVKRSG